MLVVDEVGDEQRDDLLGEVVGPVVVAAPGDREVESMGAEVAASQQVAAGLRGRIRRVGLERPRLVPRALGNGSVDLVGGHVHEPTGAVAQGGIQQALCAKDVRLHEDA